jgi:hypothetical protein
MNHNNASTNFEGMNRREFLKLSTVGVAAIAAGVEPMRSPEVNSEAPQITVNVTEGQIFLKVRRLIAESQGISQGLIQMDSRLIDLQVDHDVPPKGVPLDGLYISHLVQQEFGLPFHGVQERHQELIGNAAAVADIVDHVCSKIREAVAEGRL